MRFAGRRIVRSSLPTCPAPSASRGGSFSRRADFPFWLRALGVKIFKKCRLQNLKKYSAGLRVKSCNWVSAWPDVKNYCLRKMFRGAPGSFVGFCRQHFCKFAACKFGKIQSFAGRGILPAWAGVGSGRELVWARARAGCGSMALVLVGLCLGVWLGD